MYLRGLLHVVFQLFGGGSLVVETHVVGLQTLQRSCGRADLKDFLHHLYFQYYQPNTNTANPMQTKYKDYNLSSSTEVMSHNHLQYRK